MTAEQVEERRRRSQRLNWAAFIFAAFSLAVAVASKVGVFG